MTTLHQMYKNILAVGHSAPVPYDVYKIIGGKTLELAGDQVSLGEDFVSMEEARAAVKWYVEQLGGKVKWLD